jgi:hypothetical protein
VPHNGCSAGQAACLPLVVVDMRVVEVVVVIVVKKVVVKVIDKWWW